jgi:nucleoid-associated protein YgaU
MKSHSEIKELLALYRDLDAASRREVDQHVQECAACAEQLAAYQTMDWELAKLTDPRPDTRLRDEFYSAIGARDRQADRRMDLSLLAGRAFELALVTLLIVGLGFTLRGRLQSPGASSPLPPSGSARPSTIPQNDTSTDETTGRGNQADAETVKSGHAIDQIVVDDSIAESSAAPVEYVPSSSFQRLSVPRPSLADEEEGRVYVVQVDDTLWKLAEKYLWDGRRYAEIIEATHAKRAEDPSFALIEDPNRITPGSKLWIPADGTPPAEALTPSPKPSISPPPLAKGPNGHIAFSFWNDDPARCTYEINVIDVAACLTGPEACQANRRVFPLNNASEPALSPGGDRLGFRGWGEPPSEASPYLNCAPPVKVRYLANTTLAGTELRGTGGFWEDAHPDWSPDGQQILFDSERHADRISRILLINSDGSDERDLRIAGQHPSWAPDGSRFVYRGCDQTGNRCGLWLAYAAPVQSWDTGANIIGPVIQDDQAAHPDWSPASGQIVYQSPQSGTWDLYIVNADGSAGSTNVGQLTGDPSIEGLPSWSPDGQWIAYLSDAGGNWGIWIIREDGSERHLLFSFDGGIFTPQAVEPYGQRDWVDEQISWSQ